MLVSDLAALNVGMPDPLPFDLPSQEAATWGALYVAEGSRLGGQVLARGIAAGLPHAYLSARHAPGAWRALLASLDARAATAVPGWREDVVDGAQATFALFIGRTCQEGSGRLT